MNTGWRNLGMALVLIGCGLDTYTGELDTDGRTFAPDTDTDVVVEGDADADADADSDADADADSDADADPSGTMIISEVVDPENSPNAKYVELYNGSNQVMDISGWAIKRYANGSNSGQSFMLTGSPPLAPGQTLTVANRESAFQSAWGFTPNLVDLGVISGNGDDVYELLDGFGNRVDIYGEVGEDEGLWEYRDSVARRVSGSNQGRSFWMASDWIIVQDDDSAATPGSR